MLQLEKEQVDFLVTSTMVGEVQTFLSAGQEKIQRIVAELVTKKIAKWYFVGCGSSKAVGGAAKYLLDKYSLVMAHVYTGWEFVDHLPRGVDEQAAVIVISHTGKTEEVVKALRAANERGALTISVVNEAIGNPLGEEADFVIDYHAHAMWECHLLALYLLACEYIQATTPLETVAKLLADIQKLPGILDQYISSYEESARTLAEKTARWQGFYTIAGGPLVSLAYKEGVITNMEFMWGHGAVIESGEFRHGPFEVTDKGVPFVFLLGTDESRHITERALRFVQKHGADTIVFDYQELGQGLHSDLAPMVLFVPLEWFSYYYALVHNHNPDDRRYYGIVEY